MSRILKLVLVFCFPVSLILGACAKKETANYALISGTIKNVNNLRLNSKFTSISLDTVPIINRVINVDDKGSFLDTLYINEPRAFFIGENRSWLEFRIEPGQHLQITSDISDIENTTKFLGDAVAVNTYGFNRKKIFNRINAAYKESRNDDEATFRKKQEEYENESIQLLHSTPGLTEEYIANEKKDVFYEKVKSYLAYESNYEMIHGTDAPKLSADFLEIVSEVDFNDYSEFNRSITYQFLLRQYFRIKYAKAVGDIWKADPIVKLKIISEHIKDQNVLNEMFVMVAKYDITRSPNVQEYYDFFLEKVTRQTYKDAITAQYNDLIATQPGQVSPEFVNYQNSEGGTNSLKDFRGKYVYIDVWATWCGPCKAEIPFLKEVEKKYHNKNIAFVGLSIDNIRNIEKWKAFVKEKELGGTQIIADKETESEFVKKYQIKGVPQFILIDPDGKIVRANAPRPSDKKLIELFEELGI